MSEVLSQDQRIEAFFRGRDKARELFDALRTVIDSIGPTQVHVSKSQIAFATRHNVAVVWTPDRYLNPKRNAPLVLTVSLRRRDPSPRWKEITPVGSGRYTHHLELHAPEEIDDEVRGWLAEAWMLAEGAR